jgi:hypothetical protein
MLSNLQNQTLGGVACLRKEARPSNQVAKTVFTIIGLAVIAGVFNFLPGPSGALAFLNDSLGFVPLTILKSDIQLPWLNVWLGLALAANFAKLVLHLGQPDHERWHQIAPWLDFVQNGVGIFVLFDLITKPMTGLGSQSQYGIAHLQIEQELVPIFSILIKGSGTAMLCITGMALGKSLHQILYENPPKMR